MAAVDPDALPDALHLAVEDLLVGVDRLVDTVGLDECGDIHPGLSDDRFGGGAGAAAADESRGCRAARGTRGALIDSRHDRAPLYRSFASAEEIDAEYKPSLRVADAEALMRGYGERSAEARTRLAGRYGIPYGPTLDEKLDIFPADRPDAPVFVFIHGGYWRASRPATTASSPSARSRSASRPSSSTTRSARR